MKFSGKVGNGPLNKRLNFSGAKWRRKSCMFCWFVTGTMNSCFFVTGQIDMKFGKKRQSVCSIELKKKILKMFL